MSAGAALTLYRQALILRARSHGVPDQTRTNRMHESGASLARRILKIQSIAGLALILGALPLGGMLAISVSVGAGACLIANAMLLLWVYRDYRAQDIPRLAMRFYRGEAIKIALILGIFGAAFIAVDDLNVPIMLGSYFVVQVIPTLIAAQFGSRNKT